MEGKKNKKVKHHDCLTVGNWYREQVNSGWRLLLADTDKFVRVNRVNILTLRGRVNKHRHSLAFNKGPNGERNLLATVPSCQKLSNSCRSPNRRHSYKTSYRDTVSSFFATLTFQEQTFGAKISVEEIHPPDKARLAWWQIIVLAWKALRHYCFWTALA